MDGDEPVYNENGSECDARGDGGDRPGGVAGHAVGNPHEEGHAVGNPQEETCHDEAVRTLGEECRTEKHQQLEQMIALAEDAGEPALARSARDRLRKLRRKDPIAESQVAVVLRTKRLRRQLQWPSRPFRPDAP